MAATTILTSVTGDGKPSNEMSKTADDKSSAKTTDKSRRSTAKIKAKLVRNKITKVTKEKILSRIEEFRASLDTLETNLIACCHNLNEVEQAVDQSEIILDNLTHNFKLLSQLIGEREKQLKDAEERYKILTADDLSGCSYQNLEDASDILWAGLQAASLALSRRPEPDSMTTSSAPIDLDMENYACCINEVQGEAVPEATFYPIATPPLFLIKEPASVTTKTLQKNLDILKEADETNTKLFATLSKRLSSYQKNIKGINEQYGSKRGLLLSTEYKLETRLLQINRLSGKDSCDALSTPQLRGLCKIINKASRRLATEQAIREVYSQQKQTQDNPPSISTNENPDLCLVCFERPWDCKIDPCNHKLCIQCAKRLKFCPKCRAVIQSLVEAES